MPRAPPVGAAARAPPVAAAAADAAPSDPPELVDEMDDDVVDGESGADVDVDVDVDDDGHDTGAESGARRGPPYVTPADARQTGPRSTRRTSRRLATSRRGPCRPASPAAASRRCATRTRTCSGSARPRPRASDVLTPRRSDGPQPHLLNIHFTRLVPIAHIRLYLDFTLDESYTPTKLSLLAGTSHHDLKEFVELAFEQPRGWIDVDLSGVGGRARRRGQGQRRCRGLSRASLTSSASSSADDSDEGADDADAEPPVLRAHLVQVRIAENHQNGKDTHVRGLQIFARAPADDGADEGAAFHEHLHRRRRRGGAGEAGRAAVGAGLGGSPGEPGPGPARTSLPRASAGSRRGQGTGQSQGFDGDILSTDARGDTAGFGGRSSNGGDGGGGRRGSGGVGRRGSGVGGPVVDADADAGLGLGGGAADDGLEPAEWMGEVVLR